MEPKFKPGDKVKIPTCTHNFNGSLHTEDTVAVELALARKQDFLYVHSMYSETVVSVGADPDCDHSRFNVSDLELYPADPTPEEVAEVGSLFLSILNSLSHA